MIDIEQLECCPQQQIINFDHTVIGRGRRFFRACGNCRTRWSGRAGKVRKWKSSVFQSHLHFHGVDDSRLIQLLELERLCINMVAALHAPPGGTIDFGKACDAIEEHLRSGCD